MVAIGEKVVMQSALVSVGCQDKFYRKRKNVNSSRSGYQVNVRESRYDYDNNCITGNGCRFNWKTKEESRRIIIYLIHCQKNGNIHILVTKWKKLLQ